MKAKAVEFGYPEQLIEVSRDEITFYFQDIKKQFDPLDMRELAENTIARIAEYFVGYGLSTTICNNITIRQSDKPMTLEGLYDPMHY